MAVSFSNKTSARRVGRLKRRIRIKKRIRPELGIPRLCVFRSNKHTYLQVINDLEGKVLAAASTKDKEVAAKISGKKKLDAAKEVGIVLATRAKAKNISKVCFDRNGFRYHGRVKAVADGAREAGLDF